MHRLGGELESKVSEPPSSTPVAATDYRARLAQLAGRVSHGDTTAEIEIVEICQPWSYALAVTRIGDPETAREVANDVMLALLLALRRGSVRDCNSIGGFTYGTTVHLVHNRLRRDRGRLKTIPLDLAGVCQDPMPEHERLAQIRRIQRAFQRLDPLDRQILSLTLMEGLKPGEIATRMHLPVGLVRQRKCRASRQVSELLRVDRRPAD